MHVAPTRLVEYRNVLGFDALVFGTGIWHFLWFSLPRIRGSWDFAQPHQQVDESRKRNSQMNTIAMLIHEVICPVLCIFQSGLMVAL